MVEPELHFFKVFSTERRDKKVCDLELSNHDLGCLWEPIGQQATLLQEVRAIYVSKLEIAHLTHFKSQTHIFFSFDYKQ